MSRIHMNSGFLFYSQVRDLHRTFHFSESSISASYEDGEPRVECDYNFSLRSWVRESDVFYLDYESKKSVVLHVVSTCLLELIMV